MKLSSIQVLLLASLFLMQISFDASSEKPTNFILIYIDDMGYGDVGITGATGFSTPNLDKMAAGGMFFSRYYSPQAVCSASRAGLLTGCYPNRVGFRGAFDHTAKTGINAKEETIAEILKKKGYATAAFGKWHLGHHKQFLPTNNGFEPGKDGQPGKANENSEVAAGLYDLRRDPGEQYNVMEFYPEIVQKLENMASEAREDLGDDLTENPGKNRREPGKLGE